MLRSALGFAGVDGTVLVLLGGRPRLEETKAVRLLLPLLAAAYRGEQAIVATAGHAAVARETAAQARTLAERLETARQRLQDALSDAQEADRRKDEFLAMLAHELRNPLAPITAALEVLQHCGPDETVLRRNREIAIRQVRQLTRLVDDLLDISRITRGKIELRKAPVELAQVVGQAVETSRPLLQDRNHELTLQIPGEPLWVEADSVRLVQVVANLLNNAAKYTEPGGLVRLSIEREDGDGVIRVRDSGIGIPPETLSQVFELFMQAHFSIDRAQGGLGIGLTLVRKLVEMHGGTVQAFSEGRGCGSEFVVRLPLVLAPKAPPSPHERVPIPAAAPRRVLVVDDNQDAAETLADVLEIWGLTVDCVHDGASALSRAGEILPDIILLDIGLPGMDGYEVVRRLRALPVLAPCLLIALTGYGQEEDRRRARDAGFDHHLTKPVDLEVLRELVAGRWTAASG